MVVPAFSQTTKTPANGTGGGGEQKRLERMTERLGLTEDQRNRLTRLWEKHREEGRAIRENENLSPEDRRGQLRALREQHRAEVAAILTPEQRKQMEAIRERVREARPERPKGPAGAEGSPGSRGPRPGPGA